jgi:hypothetical protein
MIVEMNENPSMRATKEHVSFSGVKTRPIHPGS